MTNFAEKYNDVKYYDPRYDTTFKKVFSHPELLISFLNALLPLKDDEQIESIEYLSPEMVPKTPDGKFSIVDVCCKDRQSRQFIVEMQMVWSEEFRSRVLFNASKAYVRQLGKGEEYHLLKPVYSLNIVNDVFEPELPADEFYHFYQLVHEKHTDIAGSIAMVIVRRSLGIIGDGDMTADDKIRGMYVGLWPSDECRQTDGVA